MMNKKFVEQDGAYYSVDDESAAVVEASGGIVLSDADARVLAWLITSGRRGAIARVTAFANSLRERIAASQHYLQAARWPIQLTSAQAIKAGNGSEFDLAVMGREARLRGLGETVEQLADKVIGNSLIFASVGAAVDGIERATMDKIASYQGTDPDAFEAILADAEATALSEFLDIFTPFVGADAAKERAKAFFGDV